MAAKLEIPKNTISRWETGRTTPDAHSLAAIYSLGMEVGMVTEFFTPTKQRALVYWDIPPILPWGVEQIEASIRAAVREHMPGATNTLLKGFSSSSNSAANQRLESLRWRVWEDDTLLGTPDWYSEVRDQALSDSGHDPEATVVFLVTKDRKYMPLIEDLRERNVRVCVIALPSFTFPDTSRELRSTVGEEYWIEL